MLQGLAQPIANAIVFVGIVVVWYAAARAWPPTYLLIGASMGGTLSPLLWKLIGGRFDEELMNETFGWPGNS